MNEEMKKLIKETIVEMIENNDLQIETNIIEGNYDRKLVTTVYHYSDDMFSPKLIQEYIQVIENKPL